jgi:hypothetical protein
MSSPNVTRYAVDELVTARKIAGKVKGSGKAGLPLVVTLFRADTPGFDLLLHFETQVPPPPPPGVASVRRPGASLFWHGERIRGIDWTIKHEVTLNGVPTGDFIRGWHEHYWTDADESASIRTPNPLPKNEDLSALITWCCRQWNIEGVKQTMGLFNEQ